MNLENEQMGEIVAHLHSALQLALIQQKRLEVRDGSRLRKARERLNAPTTHDDGPTRQRRTA